MLAHGHLPVCLHLLPSQLAQPPRGDTAGEPQIVVVNLMPRRATLPGIEQGHLPVVPRQIERSREAGRPTPDDESLAYVRGHETVHPPTRRPRRGATYRGEPVPVTPSPAGWRKYCALTR